MGKPITFLVKVGARLGAPRRERDRFQVMEDLAFLARSRMQSGGFSPPWFEAMQARHAAMPRAPHP